MFTSGTNVAKNTDYIEECFKQKLHGIKFPTRNLVDTYLCLSRECSQAPEICIFEKL